MDSKEKELREKWNTINYYSGGALKLSVKHPLEWYVRYATPEHKSVVIVSQKALKRLTHQSALMLHVINEKMVNMLYLSH